MLLALPLSLLVWLGLYPLWVDRRLRRVGVVPGTCRNVHVSEDRYSTSFEFVTADGSPAMYISPLSDGAWASPGERVAIVYDPANPWRRARSRNELDTRSEAWTILWQIAGVELCMLVMVWFVVL
ncbi:DUF3592 domain-containing protein [Streptomyces sp. V3I7]|uniref:DUF3592 domain-containing protein n=1 Tax=Streptomyces sp. V3I7 TaxID=3042278 RepID=UPI002785E79C|nr:DUF3592 domain-containing protein [Streptomyces sp. V3I7]MDQ0992040.1 hypothetical protein [Streptomyces sp. V3I7]